MNKVQTLAILASMDFSLFPEEYRTKEFIIKAIREWDAPISLWYISEIGIKVDYDIALAKLINERVILGRMTFNRELPLPYIYYAHLNEQEISKLKTTLNLLSQ